MHVIMTEYVKPTERRGSRIRVRDNEGRCRMLPWDYSLDTPNAHDEAVKTFLADLEWTTGINRYIRSHWKSGYIYMMQKGDEKDGMP